MDTKKGTVIGIRVLKTENVILADLATIKGDISRIWILKKE